MEANVLLLLGSGLSSALIAKAGMPGRMAFGAHGERYYFQHQRRERGISAFQTNLH
jgi:hypothetical protein